MTTNFTIYTFRFFGNASIALTQMNQRLVLDNLYNLVVARGRAAFRACSEGIPLFGSTLEDSFSRL